jgi:hypothetical protein
MAISSKTCTCKEGMEEHKRESIRSAKQRKTINQKKDRTEIVDDALARNTSVR